MGVVYCVPVETTSMTVAPCPTFSAAAGDCPYTIPRRWEVEGWRLPFAVNPVALSFWTASASGSPTTNGTASGLAGGVTVTVTVVVCPPQAGARTTRADYRVTDTVRH